MGTPKRGDDPARPTKGTQELFSMDEVAVCVPCDKYTFTMIDDVGDGICCQLDEGPYELCMDDKLMIYGSDFNYGKKVSHDIIVGYQTKYYPVENICRRWFEREETWPYPDNAHFTQGLWRSARYVGCAESEKTMANGGTCQIQV